MVANDSLQVVLEVFHYDEHRHVILLLALWVVRILSRYDQIQQLRHIF